MKVVLYREGADAWRAAIRAACPSARIVTWHDGDRLEDVEDAEILVGWRFPETLLRRLPKLRWVQLICVSAHDVAQSPWIGPQVALTNTKGLYADTVADYVVWALLTLGRGFHRVLRNQLFRRWRQVTADGVAGKTLGVVGLGHIGGAVALRAAALGMRVLGVARTERPAPPGVHRVVAADAVDEWLPHCDALALCAPLTDRTRGLLNAQAIGRLKPGAFVVNVGPADLVDVPALVAALRTGAVGGAALDVFAEEPLSRLSRLWSAPNLLVTPHVSALTTDYQTRVARLLADNVTRYGHGTPLANVVDRAKGY